jgi:hypothetical protein
LSGVRGQGISIQNDKNGILKSLFRKQAADNESVRYNVGENNLRFRAGKRYSQKTSPFCKGGFRGMRNSSDF